MMTEVIPRNAAEVRRPRAADRSASRIHRTPYARPRPAPTGRCSVPESVSARTRNAPPRIRQLRPSSVRTLSTAPCCGSYSESVERTGSAAMEADSGSGSGTPDGRDSTLISRRRSSSENTSSLCSSAANRVSTSDSVADFIFEEPVRAPCLAKLERGGEGAQDLGGARDGTRLQGLGSHSFQPLDERRLPHLVEHAGRQGVGLARIGQGRRAAPAVVIGRKGLQLRLENLELNVST